MRDLPFPRGLAWRYDVVTNTWSEFGLTSFELYGGDAFLVVGERLVVASWASMKVGWFDLSTGAWTEAGRLPSAAGKCTASVASVNDSTALVDMCGTLILLSFDGRPPQAIRAPLSGFGGGWRSSSLLRSSDRTVIGLSHVVGDEFWAEPTAWGPFPLVVLDIERDAVVSWSIEETPEVNHIGYGDTFTVELTTGCSVRNVPDARDSAQPLDEVLPVADGSTAIRFMVAGYSAVYELSCADSTADAYGAALAVLSPRNRTRVWPEPASERITSRAEIAHPDE